MRAAVAAASPPALPARAASTDTRVASSVLLQQLLYLNVLFSPGWFAAFVVILARKYGQGVTLQDPDEVRIAMTIIWVITEPLRLLAGYTGNLRENVRLPATPKPTPSLSPRLLGRPRRILQQQRLIEKLYPSIQVPVLGVFLMVTLFLEGPIVAYLLGWQKDLTPLDQALNTVMAALLSAEFLAGIAAINGVMKSQVEKYYLVDFTREALFGSSKAHSG